MSYYHHTGEKGWFGAKPNAGMYDYNIPQLGLSQNMRTVVLGFENLRFFCKFDGQKTSNLQKLIPLCPHFLISLGEYRYG